MKFVSQSVQIDEWAYWLRWTVLCIVCMTGIAYDQVEIPRVIYIVSSYLLSLVYVGILFFHNHRLKMSLHYLLLPFSYFLINFIWSLAFGIERIQFDLLTLLTSCELMLLDRESKMWVYKKFRLFIIVVCLLGILCYISFSLDLGLPYDIVEFYDADNGAVYLNYHISYIYSQISTMSLRLCGLFNEPGYLGTVAALVLIIERMDLRRWGNIVIFVAASLTFSFAFWVLIVIYLAIVNYRKFWLTFGMLFFLIMTFVFLQNVNFENESINKLVERFSFEDGKFKGDNRTSDEFEQYFDKFQKSGDLIFGLGPDAKSKFQITGTAGYKPYIFNYGYVGFILLWGISIVLAIHYARGERRCLILIFLFFLSTYQRADFVNPVYLCLLFGGIDYLRWNSSLKYSFPCKVGSATL